MRFLSRLSLSFSLLLSVCCKRTATVWNHRKSGSWCQQRDARYFQRKLMMLCMAHCCWCCCRLQYHYMILRCCSWLFCRDSLSQFLIVFHFDFRYFRVDPPQNVPFVERSLQMSKKIEMKKNQRQRTHVRCSTHFIDEFLLHTNIIKLKMSWAVIDPLSDLQCVSALLLVLLSVSFFLRITF